MESKKQLQDFSEDELKAKLMQIGQALKDNDLGKEVKIKEIQLVQFKLRDLDNCDIEYQLMIEGEVSASKAGNVENLKKALNSGALKDVASASYKVLIKVKPATGGPFIPITEIIDIYTQDDKSIEHKPG